MAKMCSECRERPARPGQGYCRQCHNAYMRRYRANAPSAKSLQAQLDAIQGKSSQWPLHTVLERLVTAAEHLQDDHSCDRQRHSIKIAASRAKEYIALLNVPRGTS